LKNEEIKEKREKWEMHTVGPEFGEKTENHGKWEIHSLRRGIWRGKMKGGKFINVHCRTWNMARKLKITENEKYTVYDMKYGKENWKRWKI
jgi:hypothetical protein